MGDRINISTPVDREMNQAIEEELSYGDSKSEWLRNAIREKLNKKVES
jgi:hypothetical protein